MAPSSAFFLMVALILFATLVDGQFQFPPMGALTNGQIVSGTLCCTSTGTCTDTGAPISGAPVNLGCRSFLGSGNVDVGQTTTDDNGFFNITAPNVRNQFPITLGTFPCSVDVAVNETICPILFNSNARGGVLRAVVRSITPITDPVLGLVQNVSISGFETN